MFKLKQNFLHILAAFTIAVGIAACDSAKDEPQNALKSIDIESAIKKQYPINYNLWTRILKSNYIVEGTIHVDTNKIKKIKERGPQDEQMIESLDSVWKKSLASKDTTLKKYFKKQKELQEYRKNNSNYINIEIVIDSVLKGDIPSKEINITKFIYNRKTKALERTTDTTIMTDMLDDSKLFTLNGKKTIVFLVKSPADTSKYYNYGSTSKSFLARNAENRTAIINELNRQRKIAEGKNLSKVCTNSKMSSKVHDIIENMLVESKATGAYTELEKLGFQAVPAIICQMDDRRELAVKGISLENKSPQAWEAMRHYSPKLVVDVLEAILNQITGNSLGSIHNGGTEEERANTVNGWRIYLWHLFND